MSSGAQMSSPRRAKWLHITIGVVLIVVAVALTVGWQILGPSDAGLSREAGTVRWVKGEHRIG